MVIVCVVYVDVEIVILDDFLLVLDAYVVKDVFKRCICGVL